MEVIQRFSPKKQFLNFLAVRAGLAGCGPIILIIVFVWLPDIHNTQSVVQVLHVVVSLKGKFTQK